MRSTARMRQGRPRRERNIGEWSRQRKGAERLNETQSSFTQTRMLGDRVSAVGSGRFLAGVFACRRVSGLEHILEDFPKFVRGLLREHPGQPGEGGYAV